MRLHTFLMAGAVLAFVQPAISSAQVEDPVTATPQAATEAVAPAGPAPAEVPAEATTAAATALPSSAPTQPAAEQDPMVCRTQVETGTLGRRYKICMTKSQWEKHRLATRKFMNTINRSRATQPGGESLGPSSGSPGG